MKAAEQDPLTSQTEKELEEEVKNYLKAIDILIANKNYSEEQTASLRNFIGDERKSLAAKIQSFGERRETLIEKRLRDITTSPARMADEEYRSIVKLQFSQFRKNIADFILLIEI